MLITPGNHDVSNAIGYYRPMSPKKDRTALLGEYAVMHERERPDTTNLVYVDSVFDYSRDIAGLHFQFVCIWPDSANRAWMENDLRSVSTNTPVFIFTHDPPGGDPKHFTNPTANSAMNAQDKFENLLSEVYSTDYEKRWDDFLKRHSNIRAYFHGYSNYQQFYEYKGVDDECSLPCFRVDSPMKGKFSSTDESLLSFQLLTIDPTNRTAVVKECFWNRGKPVSFGEERTLRF